MTLSPTVVLCDKKDPKAAVIRPRHLRTRRCGAAEPLNLPLIDTFRRYGGEARVCLAAWSSRTLGLRSQMRVSAAPGGCEVRVRRRLSRSAAPN